MEITIGRVNINLTPFIGAIAFYFWKDSIAGSVVILAFLMALKD